MSKLKIPRPYVKIGDYLCKKRLEKNITQRAVAEKLGYSSAQFISNFERGIATPPLEKLKVLNKLYGIDAGHMTTLLMEAERTRVATALGAPVAGAKPKKKKPAAKPEEKATAEE